MSQGNEEKVELRKLSKGIFEGDSIYVFIVYVNIDSIFLILYSNLYKIVIISLLYVYDKIICRKMYIIFYCLSFKNVINLIIVWSVKLLLL